MSTALATRLIASGAVSASDAEAAFLASLVRRIPFVRALIDTGAIGEAALDRELSQIGGMGLRHVAGMPELVNRLPPHFCRRMGVLPVRVDHAARTVEVAAADPLDPHIPAEITFHLGVPVRVLRATLSAIEDAIRRIELEAEAAAGRGRRATPPFPHGAPESSNPPPPPGTDPAPIPLVRRTGGPGGAGAAGGEKPADTLRLYKATLRPAQPDLDFGDSADQSDNDLSPPPPSSERNLTPPQGFAAVQPPGLATWRAPSSPEPPRRGAQAAQPAAEPARRGTEAPQTPPPTRTPAPWPGASAATDLAPPPPAPSSSSEAIEPAPKTLRDSTPRRRDLGADPLRLPESNREQRPRGVKDSTPRLRDLIDQPPPLDRLRDSTPRLREMAGALRREAGDASDDAAPLSSMVARQEGAAPGEPPAVSFPSMPPPSISDQPSLLAAEEPVLVPAQAPLPAADAGQAAARQRRASRFARPAIDIQLPQPPSERAARQKRTVWDVPMGDDPKPAAAAPPPMPPPEAPRRSALLAPPAPPAPPLLAPRPETFDLTAVLEALRIAASRDDVVAAALRGLRTVGRRAAIFVVRRDGFHGWAGNVELGDEAALRQVAIPHEAPSLFATAVATGTYFGPIPGNVVHASLLSVIEHPASDVAVAIARAGGKPVMALFADDLVDIKRRVLPRLIEISDAVGAALSRLIASRL